MVRGGPTESNAEVTGVAIYSSINTIQTTGAHTSARARARARVTRRDGRLFTDLGVSRRVCCSSMCDMSAPQVKRVLAGAGSRIAGVRQRSSIVYKYIYIYSTHQRLTIWRQENATLSKSRSQVRTQLLPSHNKQVRSPAEKRVAQRQRGPGEAAVRHVK